jgi:hypothetical protein
VQKILSLFALVRVSIRPYLPLSADRRGQPERDHDWPLASGEIA